MLSDFLSQLTAPLLSLLTVLALFLASDCMGIGRHGRTVWAIRDLLRILEAQQRRRIVLSILDAPEGSA